MWEKCQLGTRPPVAEALEDADQLAIPLETDEYEARELLNFNKLGYQIKFKCNRTPNPPQAHRLWNKNWHQNFIIQETMVCLKNL